MAKYQHGLEQTNVTVLCTDVTLLGQLYTLHISYFMNVVMKHITKYETLTIHFSYSMRISCFIKMSRKNKSRNYLTFSVNVNPSAKCEKQKKEHETRKKWCEIPCYILFFFFFAFRNRLCVFRDKCIASLTVTVYLSTLVWDRIMLCYITCLYLSSNTLFCVKKKKPISLFKKNCIRIFWKKKKIRHWQQIQHFFIIKLLLISEARKIASYLPIFRLENSLLTVQCW